MATFREIADYILSLPKEKQEEQACFWSMEDDYASSLEGSEIKLVTVQDIDTLDGSESEKYDVIAVSYYELEDNYKHYII